MIAFYEGLIIVEKLFFFCALLGGALFALRLLMMLFGGHGGDADVANMDVLHGHIDVSHGGESDVSFKLITLQGVSGFFMMFGLIGLGISKALPAHTALQQIGALAGGSAAGLATAWMLAKLFALMMKLQCDGTTKVVSCIGQQGSVYLNVPAEGIGKVQIVVQGALRIYDAVSKNKQTIKTGDRVVVTDVSGGNVLVVEKL